jgi:type III secretion system inner membrane ring protein
VIRLFARRSALILCLLCAACHDDLLLDKLDQQQANETLAALQQRNIAARKELHGKSGYSIVVPPDDFVAAVDTLSALSLPSRPRVEIAQAFPGDAMVASPTAERARLLSMIEQRLEQTIRSIDLVERAAVHLSYALDEPTGRRTPSIHIAALVVHEAGADEQALIAKLKRFLKNAVADAHYDDISITLFASAPRQFAAPTRIEHMDVSGNTLLVISLGAAALLGGIAVVAHGMRGRKPSLRAWWPKRRTRPGTGPIEASEPT